MYRQKKSFWQLFQQYLLVTLLISILSFFGFQLLKYKQQTLLSPLIPSGTTIAGVDVSNIHLNEIETVIAPVYNTPISVYHQEQRVEITPQEIEFQIDYGTMQQQFLTSQENRTFYQGFWDYLVTLAWGRPMIIQKIPLVATHNPETLNGITATISSFLDNPPQQPKITEQKFLPGSPGFVTDLEATLPDVTAAFYRPNQREAKMIIIQADAPELNIEWLAQAIKTKTTTFDGLTSIFILDLKTGEEININSDVALSGLSVIKIPIVLETYRAIDRPISEHLKLINETLVLSGNFSANLLLDVVAGQDNAYLGSDILTASMRKLGLQNTFIATPYEEPARPERPTYQTPANSKPDLLVSPDPAMQTTAEEMGSLLAMIYYCAQGQGTLIAVYPDQITPEECQAIIDTLVLNTEGNLIRFGVPHEVPVAHKHGWDSDTHGDAGIVFSPGGDYIIVEFLAADTDWLVSDITFPILREISRLTYNYFNHDNPYLGDALFEEQRFDEE